MTIVPSSQSDSRRLRGFRLRPVLMASGIAVALAGCASVDQRTTGATFYGDYRQTHPISIDEMIETFDVPISVDTVRLPAGMKGSIRGFAQKFRVSDSGVIAIVLPKGSPNARVASARAVDIEQVLLESGIQRRAIQFRNYRAGPNESSAPIRLAYARIAANTAPCGLWPDDLTDSGQNGNYYNFGCATQQNLAAMVNNPLDLLYPRAVAPPDAARRAAVLQNYDKGTPTQTDHSKEIGGTIAQGVGQ
jgi:pilus assembly protein CpaD